MKILLINPPIREWSKPNIIPLGLAYIAATLENAGYDVEVMDINANRWSEEEVESRIRDAEYDVVGVGALVTVYRYVKWLIGIAKKCHPGKRIVVGGSVGTSVPHLILEKTEADIVCLGEGEITMPELIDAIVENRKLSGVNGIWYKDNDGKIQKNPPREPIKDLNTIPFPAWKHFPMDVYLKNPVGAPNRNKWVDGAEADDNILSVNISATRGCPYQCIYCYHDFMGSRYRYRSPKNIVAEIKDLYEKYGVTYIHFMDDEFCLIKDFVYEFCKELKKATIADITWGCSGRANLMSEDLIKTMVDAGCVLIGYGIESGSQRMLDVMKKGVSVDQAKKAIRMTQKYLGWADCAFMIGTPGETRESIQETVCFCKELDLNPEVIFFMTPYPGTELYRYAMQHNMIGDEEEYVLKLGEQGENIRVNFTDISDEELYKIQTEMIEELGAWNKLKHPEAR